MFLMILLRHFSRYGVLFSKKGTRRLKGACLSRKKLSLNRFLSRNECFIRKEDNY